MKITKAISYQPDDSAPSCHSREKGYSLSVRSSRDVWPSVCAVLLAVLVCAGLEADGQDDRSLSTARPRSDDSGRIYDGFPPHFPSNVSCMVAYMPSESSPDYAVIAYRTNGVLNILNDLYPESLRHKYASLWKDFVAAIIFDRDNRNEDAIRLLNKVIQEAGDDLDCPYAVNSQAMIAGIEMSAGKTEDAISHFEKALGFADDRLNVCTNRDAVIHLQDNKLNILLCLTVAMEEQGRMGCAEKYRVLMDRAVKTLEKTVDAEKGSPVDTEKAEISLIESRQFSACILWNTGLYEAARDTAEELLRRADDVIRRFETKVGKRHGKSSPGDGPNVRAGSFRVAMAQLHMWLAEEAFFFEDVPSAIRHAEDRMKIPKYYDPADYYSSQADYALYLSREDGLSPKVARLIYEAASELKLMGYLQLGSQADVALAAVLGTSGDNEQGIQVATRAIDSSRQMDNHLLLASALSCRGRLNLAAGDYARAEQDLRESLSLLRQIPRKPHEIDVYELYGQCQYRMGDPVGAAQTWRSGMAAAEDLRLHFKSLRILLRMADMYNEMNRRDILDPLVKDINAFMGKHRNEIPPPTMQLYSETMHRCRAVNSATAAARPNVSPLPETAEPPAPLANASAGSGKVQKWNAVLDPRAVVSRVLPGEYARARFTLFNPGDGSIDGVLSLEAGNCVTDWSEKDQTWHVSPEETNGVFNSLAMTIAPGATKLVFVQCDEVPGFSTQEVAVIWRDGRISTSKWEFGSGLDTRAVSFVSANIVDDNPFKHVGLYHELYYRGVDGITQDIRVKASADCRVEIIDESTSRYVAVDATGDGDFYGVGDVLYRDVDASGFPDVAMDGRNNAVPIEFRVFLSKAALSEGTVEIELFVGTGAGWELQAVDTIEVVAGSGGRN